MLQCYSVEVITSRITVFGDMLENQCSAALSVRVGVLPSKGIPTWPRSDGSLYRGLIIGSKSTSARRTMLTVQHNDKRCRLPAVPEQFGRDRFQTMARTLVCMRSFLKESRNCSLPPWSVTLEKKCRLMLQTSVLTVELVRAPPLANLPLWTADSSSSHICSLLMTLRVLREHSEEETEKGNQYVPTCLHFVETELSSAFLLEKEA